MKTISEQLKDLDLKLGDLCEIEGVEGRAVVLEDKALMVENREGEQIRQLRLYARSDKENFKGYYRHFKVTCGWKAHEVKKTNNNRLIICYTQTLPIPEVTSLPEAVEKAIEEGLGMDLDCGWRHVARAVIAECDRKIEAAKPKGTIADIVAAKLAKEV